MLIDPEELLKFKKLLDAGAISQEEYDAKKAQVLNLPQTQVDKNPGQPSVEHKEQIRPKDSLNKWVTCTACNKDINTFNALYENEAWYCNDACATKIDAARSKSAVEWKRPEYRKTSSTVTCQVCSDECPAANALTLNGKLYYCSQKCYDKGTGGDIKLNFKGLLTVCLAVGGLLLFWKCVMDFSGAPSSPAASQVTSENHEWYEGGTLHNASDSDWLGASDANRLATASDFVAKLKDKFGLANATSMDQFRGPAEQMNACLTEAAKARSGRSVSELASVCVLMLTK